MKNVKHYDCQIILLISLLYRDGVLAQYSFQTQAFLLEFFNPHPLFLNHFQIYGLTISEKSPAVSILPLPVFFYFFLIFPSHFYILPKSNLNVHLLSRSHGLRPRKLKASVGGATSSCPGSYPKVTCPEWHVSHICQLMIE